MYKDLIILRHSVIKKLDMKYTYLCIGEYPINEEILLMEVFLWNTILE